MMKVYKYGTGQSIPDEAIYLWSCKNGKMNNSSYPDDYEYVWHYFLVNEEDDDSFKVDINKPHAY